MEDKVKLDTVRRSRRRPMGCCGLGESQANGIGDRPICSPLPHDHERPYHTGVTTMNYDQFKLSLRWEAAQSRRYKLMRLWYGMQKWLGLFEQLFPKDKWSHSWVEVLGKAQQS